MRRAALTLFPLLVACDAPADDPTRPYLELRGAIDTDGPLIDVTGAWLWVWIRNGRIAAVAEAAEIEPELGGYRASLFTPPEVSPGLLQPPADLANFGDSTLLFGTLALLDSDVDPDTIRVEPVPLLHAILEGRVPVDSVWSIADEEAESPVLAGWTTDRLALFSSGSVHTVHIEGHSGWTGTPCELPKVGPGLALYGDPEDPEACAWTERAPPGTQSTFDGIDLHPPSG